jgi:hypothetical protein
MGWIAMVDMLTQMRRREEIFSVDVVSLRWDEALMSACWAVIVRVCEPLVRSCPP